MSKRVVITGTGALTPQGKNIKEIIKIINENSIKSNDKDISFKLIKDIDDTSINKRLKRKIDKFSIYGLLAAEMALVDSGIDIKSVSPYDIGIYVGNSLGGWSYIENDVISLHQQGNKMVSPYMATAWFPAALQGQISLKYGIKGQSKTFSSSDVAGLQAIVYATKAIKNNRVKVILAGASENISSGFVQDIIKDSYHNVTCNDKLGKNIIRNFSEGSAFIVIEELEHAIERKANILCEITDCIDSKLGHFHESLSNNVNSGLTSEKISYFLDGMFENECSIIEANSVIKKESYEVINLRRELGNQFSVSGVIDLAVAANMIYSKASESSANSCEMIIQRMNYMNQMDILKISNLRNGE